MQKQNISSLKLRNIMGASILGVTAGIIAIFAERADAALTGGNATPMGYVNTYTWIIVSACLFGVVGAIITTEIQAIIGLIAASNPLSWLWPFINPIFAFGVGIVSLIFSKISKNPKIRIEIILMSTVCAILDIPLVYVVIVMALNLPFVVYQISLPLYIVLQLIPSTLLSYLIIKVIVHSGIISK